MILITGGLGFIGSHTARALLNLGESCVLAQRTPHATPPDYLAAELGHRLFVERLDCTDRDSFLELGQRHRITGVVHLAGAALSMTDPLENLRINTACLFNALEAARTWEVRRISVASTLGVYGGVLETSWREDLPLPMLAAHPIPVFKKSAELFATLVGAQADVDVVNVRFGAWGPGGRSYSPFFAFPQLVHAAVHGNESAQPTYAGDGLDVSYVKDCGRGIALLQVADTLNHTTYNVGCGRVMTNGEVVAAIKEVLPDARLDLAAGRNPDGPITDAYLDVTRIHEDTGYQPEYDAERAVTDYVDWLRAGHEY